MAPAESSAATYADGLAAGVDTAKQNPVCTNFCGLLLQRVDGIVHVALPHAGGGRVHNADDFKFGGCNLINRDLFRFDFRADGSGDNVGSGSTAGQSNGN